MRNFKSNRNITQFTPGTQEMIDLDMNELRTSKTGRILDSPGNYIPNTRKFKISIKDFDPLFERYGIEKRLKPLIENEPYRNKAMNRYMEHQIRRLDNARDNPKLYGKIGNSILNSNVFRVAAFNHVFRSGHRKLPFNLVMSINRKVDALIKQGATGLEYRRVYIPKDEGKVRPLGVPTPEFRILLHMHANLLSYFLKNSFKHQHAYLPGLGTLSAGKEIFLGGLLRKKNIHEGDFKGFFDNIEPEYISSILRKKGLPEEMVMYYEKINISPIQLPEKLEMDEERNIRVGSLHRLIGNMTELGDSYFNRDNNTKFYFRERHEDFRGVPQGAPTSPILANLVMQDGIDAFPKSDKVVAYADDSISSSDSEIKAPVTNSSIIINENKSKLVKKDGVGIGTLKFLGLTFNGKEFQAETKKGAKLLMTQEIKELIKDYDLITNENSLNDKELYKKLKQAGLKNNLYKKTDSKYSGEDFFKSKLMGFIQNRMYSNSGNLEDLQQDFNLNFMNSSGMNTSLRKEGDNLDIFNSSSYASGSLCNILRGNKIKNKNLRRSCR